MQYCITQYEMVWREKLFVVQLFSILIKEQDKSSDS